MHLVYFINNQNVKIAPKKMTNFLLLTNTYESVIIALANENNILKTDIIPKQDASKELIPRIDALLAHHTFNLSDIHCCIVNQGPGPFTTLRTVIATANGLNFATSLPLIGINELKSFLTEYTDNSYPQTVVLLNAFNHEVYYSMLEPNNTFVSGCMNINLLLPEIQKKFHSHSIRFIGNGAELYQDKIITHFTARAYIPNPLPQSSSIEWLRQQGLLHWDDQTSISTQLQPLYLKQVKPL